MTNPAHTAPALDRRFPRMAAVAVALAVVLAAVGIMPAAAAPTAGAERVAVIVQLTEGSDPAAGAARAARSGATVTQVYRNVFPGFAVDLPAVAVAGLARRPDVVAITPDHVAELFDTSGQQTGATWGLDRSDQRNLPLDQTYSYPGTATGVRAYVIDTGIRADHAEFGGRVAPGATAINDGRGTGDCNGHGTHVAGTIGGSVYGVAKDVTLVPVRVFGCSGGTSYSTLIAALDWVIANHQDQPAGTRSVVNMSLGGPSDSGLNLAVDRTVAAGIPVVVAAGNDNADACRTSPASAASAVTVGATQSNDRRASYSNFGSCLDLFAPGTSITAAWPSSSSAINTISGTSMASPHVAGAVALLLAADASLTASQVSDRLVSDATSGVVSSAGRRSPNLLLFIAPAPEAPDDGTEEDTGGGNGGDTGGGTEDGTDTGTGDGDESGDTKPDPEPEPEPVVLSGSVVVQRANNGRWLSGIATVTVTDASSSTAIAGSTVKGRWYQNSTSLVSSMTGTTLADGTVSFSSGNVRGSSLRFCIDSLELAGAEPVEFTQFQNCGSL